MWVLLDVLPRTFALLYIAWSVPYRCCFFEDMPFKLAMGTDNVWLWWATDYLVDFILLALLVVDACGLKLLVLPEHVQAMLDSQAYSEKSKTYSKKGRLFRGGFGRVHRVRERRKRIARGFLYFFVASAPLELLAIRYDFGGTYLALFKLNRLLHLLDAPRLGRTAFVLLEDSLHVPGGALRLCYFYLLMAMAAHCGGCLFYVAARFDARSPNSWARKRVDETWPEYDGLWNITGSGELVYTSDRRHRYYRALYWAINMMVTTGFGDINPLTRHETICSICFMFLGLLLTGAGIGNITLLFMQTNRSNVEMDQRLDAVRRYGKYRLLSEVMTGRMTDYVEWAATKTSFDDAKFVSELPASLRSAVLKDQVVPLLRRLPCLAENLADEALVNTLATKLDSAKYTPMDDIVRPAELLSGALIVAHGELGVRTRPDDTYWEECRLKFGKRNNSSHHHHHHHHQDSDASLGSSTGDLSKKLQQHQVQYQHHGDAAPSETTEGSFWNHNSSERAFRASTQHSHATLRRGDHFGASSLFCSKVQCRSLVQAHSYCDVFWLSRKVMLDLVREQCTQSQIQAMFKAVLKPNGGSLSSLRELSFVGGCGGGSLAAAGDLDNSNVALVASPKSPAKKLGLAGALMLSSGAQRGSSPKSNNRRRTMIPGGNNSKPVSPRGTSVDSKERQRSTAAFGVHYFRGARVVPTQAGDVEEDDDEEELTSDSFLDNDDHIREAEAKWANRYAYLKPEAPLRKAFETAKGLALFFNSIMLPLAIKTMYTRTFVNDGRVSTKEASFIASYLVDFFFLVDLWMTCTVVPQLDEKGVLVARPQSLRALYKRTHFLWRVEVLSVLPWDCVGWLPAAANSRLSWWALARVAKLPHCFLRIGPQTNVVSDYVTLISKQAMRIVHLNAVMLLLTHYVGVGFILVARVTQYERGRFVHTWIYADWTYSSGVDRVEDGLDCANLSYIAHSGTATRTEMREHYQCTSKWSQCTKPSSIPYCVYLRSIYFAMLAMSTLGYGDIVPTRDNEIEIMYVTITVLFGGLLLPAMVGGLASLIADLNTAHRDYRTKSFELRDSMRRQNLQPSLRHALLKYHNYVWTRHKGANERTVLKQLPKPLRRCALVQAVGPAFGSASFFSRSVGVEEFARQELVSRLESRVFLPGDVVLAEGDLSRLSLFFIERGDVDEFAARAGATKLAAMRTQLLRYMEDLVAASTINMFEASDDEDDGDAAEAQAAQDVAEPLTMQVIRRGSYTVADPDDERPNYYNNSSQRRVTTNNNSINSVLNMIAQTAAVNAAREKKEKKEEKKKAQLQQQHLERQQQQLQQQQQQQLEHALQNPAVPLHPNLPTLNLLPVVGMLSSRAPSEAPSSSRSVIPGSTPRSGRLGEKPPPRLTQIATDDFIRQCTGPGGCISGITHESVRLAIQEAVRANHAAQANARQQQHNESNNNEEAANGLRGNPRRRPSSSLKSFISASSHNLPSLLKRTYSSQNMPQQPQPQVTQVVQNQQPQPKRRFSSANADLTNNNGISRGSAASNPTTPRGNSSQAFRASGVTDNRRPSRLARPDRSYPPPVRRGSGTQALRQTVVMTPRGRHHQTAFELVDANSSTPTDNDATRGGVGSTGPTPQTTPRSQLANWSAHITASTPRASMFHRAATSRFSSSRGPPAPIISEPGVDPANRSPRAMLLGSPRSARGGQSSISNFATSGRRGSAKRFFLGLGGTVTSSQGELDNTNAGGGGGSVVSTARRRDSTSGRSLASSSGTPTANKNLASRLGSGIISLRSSYREVKPDFGTRSRRNGGRRSRSYTRGDKNEEPSNEALPYVMCSPVTRRHAGDFFGAECLLDRLTRPSSNPAEVNTNKRTVMTEEERLSTRQTRLSKDEEDDLDRFYAADGAPETAASTTAPNGGVANGTVGGARCEPLTSRIARSYADCFELARDDYFDVIRGFPSSGLIVQHELRKHCKMDSRRIESTLDHLAQAYYFSDVARKLRLDVTTEMKIVPQSDIEAHHLADDPEILSSVIVSQAVLVGDNSSSMVPSFAARFTALATDPAAAMAMGMLVQNPAQPPNTASLPTQSSRMVDFSDVDNGSPPKLSYITTGGSPVSRRRRRRDYPGGDAAVSPSPLTTVELSEPPSPFSVRRWSSDPHWSASIDPRRGSGGNTLDATSGSSSNGGGGTSVWWCERVARRWFSSLTSFLKARFGDPESSGQICWAAMMCTALIYQAFSTPLHCAFITQDPVYYVFDWFIDLVAMIDAALTWSVFGLMHDGQLVLDSSALFETRRASGRIVADIFYCAPIDVLAYVYPRGPLSAWVQALLRLPKLFRISRLPLYADTGRPLFEDLEARVLTKRVAALTRLCGIVLLVSHWFACIYYAMARWKWLANADPPELVERWSCTWIRRQIVNQDLPLSTGFLSGGGAIKDAAEQYLRALNWSLATLVAVCIGDVRPYTCAESLWVYVAAAVGMSVSATIIGSVVAALHDSSSSGELAKRADRLERYMQQHGVPLDLRTRVNEYTISLQSANLASEFLTGLKEPSASLLTSTLPHTLCARVAVALRLPVLEKCPLFEPCDEVLKRLIAHVLVPETYSAGDLVIQFGERGEAMYFLLTGTVTVLGQNNSTVYATLKSGSFFGEGALFSNVRRAASIKCAGFTECLRLSRKDLQVQLKAFRFKPRRLLDKFNEIRKRNAKHNAAIQKGLRDATTPGTRLALVLDVHEATLAQSGMQYTVKEEDGDEDDDSAPRRIGQRRSHATMSITANPWRQQAGRPSWVKRVSKHIKTMRRRAVRDVSARLQQGNHGRALWDGAEFISALYLAVITPFRATFTKRDDLKKTVPGSLYFDWVVCDFLFAVGIVVRLHVKNHRSSAASTTTKGVDDNYSMTDTLPKREDPNADLVGSVYRDSRMFIIDVASVLPLELLAFAELAIASINGNASSNNNLRSKNVVLALRLNRLLRLGKLNSLFENLSRYALRRHGIRVSVAEKELIWIIVIYIFAIHWHACGWFALHRYFEPSAKATWATFDKLAVRRDYELDESDDDYSYISRVSTTDCYVRAFHFALTVLSSTGNGDIKPMNPLETAYMLVVIVTGACLLSSLISAWTLILEAFDTEGLSALNAKMHRYEKYMEIKKLPLKLRELILAHHRHCWTRQLCIDEDTVTSDLTWPLRMDLALCVHRDAFARIKFFASLPKSIARRLAAVATTQLCAEDDCVYTEGDVGSEMYFIYIGGCRLFPTAAALGLPRSNAPAALRSVHQGDHFGELCVESLSCVRTETAVAMMRTELYALDRRDLDEEVRKLLGQQQKRSGSKGPRGLKGLQPDKKKKHRSPPPPRTPNR